MHEIGSAIMVYGVVTCDIKKKFNLWNYGIDREISTKNKMKAVF